MEKFSETKLDHSSSAKKASWITLRFILAISLFLLTLFIFVEITDEIVLEKENGFDIIISTAVSSLVSPFVTSLMNAFTFFGSQFFLIPAYLVLITYYILRKRSRLAVDVAMIGLSSTGLLFLLKDIFKRHRPLDPLISNVTGFSFPSGHSFSSFTFFGLLIYITWKTNLKKFWKIFISFFLFLLATTIAFSRVYLRVHYPSDVVAGFCLSVAWLISFFMAIAQSGQGIYCKGKRK